MLPFKPINESSLTMSVTETSADETISAPGNVLHIFNLGTSSPAFIRFGVDAQTAVTTDYAIPPGEGEYFLKNTNPDGDDTVAAVCFAGESTTLILSVGDLPTRTFGR